METRRRFWHGYRSGAWGVWRSWDDDPRAKVRGFWRKRKPFDCGNPRCGLCHSEKFYGAKARGNERRRAIDFDLRAA